MVPDPGALPKQRTYVVSIFSEVIIKLETACTGGISFPSSLQSSCYLGNYFLNQSPVKSMLRFPFCLNFGSDLSKASY